MGGNQPEMRWFRLQLSGSEMIGFVIRFEGSGLFHRDEFIEVITEPCIGDLFTDQLSGRVRECDTSKARRLQPGQRRFDIVVGKQTGERAEQIADLPC